MSADTKNASIVAMIWTVAFLIVFFGRLFATAATTTRQALGIVVIVSAFCAVLGIVDQEKRSAALPTKESPPILVPTFAVVTGAIAIPLSSFVGSVSWLHAPAPTVHALLNSGLLGTLTGLTFAIGLRYRIWEGLAALARSFYSRGRSQRPTVLAVTALLLTVATPSLALILAMGIWVSAETARRADQPVWQWILPPWVNAFFVTFTLGAILGFGLALVQRVRLLLSPSVFGSGALWRPSLLDWSLIGGGSLGTFTLIGLFLPRFLPESKRDGGYGLTIGLMSGIAYLASVFFPKMFETKGS